MFTNYKIEEAEIFQNTINIKAENNLFTPTFNIENAFGFLINQAQNCSNNSTFSIGIGRDIFTYYSNISFSHNYDIILSNKEIIPTLINFSNNGTDDEKLIFLKIIHIIIQKDQLLAIAFVQNGFLNVFERSLLQNNKMNTSVFLIISYIFKEIVRYNRNEILNPLFQSNIPSLILSSLADSASSKLSELESEFVFDKFILKNEYSQAMTERKIRKKYSSKILQYDKQKELYDQACFEEIILSTIEYIHSFCGSMSQDNTQQILRTCLVLMSTANKTYLCESIAKCTEKMIIVNPYAGKISHQIGLISLLTNCLKSTSYETAFLSILNVDIAFIRCVLKQIENCQHDPDVRNEFQEICNNFFDTVNTVIIYDLMMYSNRTIQHPQYLQMVISKAFELLSLNIELNPLMIVYDRSAKFGLPEYCLDFSQILGVLSVLRPDESAEVLGEEGAIFDLQMNAIVFLLNVINCSVCIDSHPDFVNELFGEFGSIIIGILDSCVDDVTLKALSLLHKLLTKVQDNSNGEKSLENFFVFLEDEDFQKILNECQTSENAMIKDLANQLYSACSNADFF